MTIMEEKDQLSSAYLKILIKFKPKLIEQMNESYP
jgi:hypothetical protein